MVLMSCWMSWSAIFELLMFCIVELASGDICESMNFCANWYVEVATLSRTAAVVVLDDFAVQVLSGAVGGATQTLSMMNPQH